uniref:Putative C4 protein n=1 Tax=Pepper yellow leaf curl virus TaxID=881944 RepID=A0A7T8CM27_9GEMI|nr:putative C4 protein [Pepper yellow leaf curl virus]
MPKIFSSLIHSAPFQKKRHFPNYNPSKPLQIKNTLRSAESFTKMGLLISTCLFNSKGNSSARIQDSSTSYPQPGQHISIRTFRELNQAPTSRPTSTRTETPSTGERSRSTVEVLEEAARMLMTPAQRH